MATQNYLENLKWRYATKKFDPSKPLAEENMEQLLDAIQLSASSYGLQPYEVMVIKDKETRKKLHPAAFEQPQILDASYLLVFCAQTKIDEAYLDKYIDNIVTTRGMKKEDLSGMKDMVMNAVISNSTDEKTAWAKRQAYIALGNFLGAAASMKIDACPMEGFNPSQFDEILDLKSKNLTTAVIATVGYRDESDSLATAKKVRKPKKELFTRI
ncbi:MAG: NAD(P)H-dependent oxidoreductase [Bacteroidota bacterium]